MSLADMLNSGGAQGGIMSLTAASSVLAPVLLQQLPSLSGLLSTLIVIALVIVVGRFLLDVALKIVVVAAVVIGLLWLLGALSVLGL
jgi:hypothetical protein